MQEENNQNPQPVEEEKSGIYTESRSTYAGTEKPSFFTFNFNTLLGGLALVGLIALSFLHFSKKNENVGAPAFPIQKVSGKSLSVVFVNTDSINMHYEFVKILRRDLESSGKKLQTEVLAEQSALEKEAADFQRQMGSNLIPEDKAKVIYEQLMQKQQALMDKKERYTQQVAEQEMNMNIRLVDSVTAFLKRFNRQYRFDYIMGYKTAGEILVANDTLDITKSVLGELNREYQQRKK
ncbi:MAG: OmpH family outer membrane protein [Bacteroidota bacterium]